MFQIVPQGYYPGKIKNYGISTTRNGKPQSFIVFEVIHPDGGPQMITWYGGLAEVASEEGKKPPVEFTVKTLLDCGFTGEAIENMAAGPDSNCIPLEKEMSLTIEDNEYEGNISSRVRWVNPLGSVGGPRGMDQSTAANTLNTGALRAALLKERSLREQQQRPVTAAPVAPAPVTPPKTGKKPLPI